MLNISKNHFHGPLWNLEWLSCIVAGLESTVAVFEHKIGRAQVFIHVFLLKKCYFIFTKMVISILKLKFSLLEKYRTDKNGKKIPPVIQKSEFTKQIWHRLMRKWLINETECKKFLNSRPASEVEAFHASCYGFI